MMDDVSETDRIERDLAATRARMDHRLEELQDHLTPKQMLNDALSYFQGGEGADFTKDLVNRARANPLPTALAGVGIAWLMASSHAAQHGPAATPVPQHDVAARIRYAEGSVQRFDHDDDDSYAGRLDDARGAVVGVTRNASDTASTYARRVQEAIAAAAQSVSDTSRTLVGSAGTMLGQVGDGVAKRAVSLQEGTNTMAKSTQSAMSSITGNPLALGGIAALVGIVAGALLPTSNEEEAALGSLATKLHTAGRELAQEVVDRGSHVVADTLDAGKGSAAAHGLTGDKPAGELLADIKSGDFLGDVKEVVQETLQAGRDSAQTHLAADADQQGG